MRLETNSCLGLLTVFRRSLDHVELVNLFSVVLGLSVILATALLPVPAQLLHQLFGAVIECQHLVRDLIGAQGLRRTRQSQFAQDLSPDGLHSLLLDMVNVHSGTSRQREDHGHTV